MSIKLALVLVSISVGLLAVYGSDVVLNIATGERYLPFDETARGYGLGVPSLILPIVAYFISKKETSHLLGSLIVTSGVLIIIGGITILARTDVAASPAMILSESVPLLVIGGYITFLGSRKIRGRSSPQITH